MGEEISDLSWFQNSMAGLQIQFRYLPADRDMHKIKKAQLNLEKAKTTKEMVTEQLLLAGETAAGITW